MALIENHFSGFPFCFHAIQNVFFKKKKFYIRIPLGELIKPKGRVQMPFTTIRVIEKVFTDEQKKQMLENVTEALVEVCGEKTIQGQWVTIEEVKKGDWAIGGQIANPK